MREWSLPSMTASRARGIVCDMSPLEIRARLYDLAQERIAAERAGLSSDPRYIADLESEIVEYRVALTGSMVTEIAVFRGELFGRDVG
jgi:hypothetical protein